MNRLQVLLANKHTSLSALVWLMASAIEQLGPVWFPEHKEQFEMTAKWIEKAAVAYGLFFAGDASAGGTSGGTAFLTKTSTPPADAGTTKT